MTKTRSLEPYGEIGFHQPSTRSSTRPLFVVRTRLPVSRGGRALHDFVDGPKSTTEIRGLPCIRADGAWLPCFPQLPVQPQRQLLRGRYFGFPSRLSIQQPPSIDPVILQVAVFSSGGRLLPPPERRFLPAQNAETGKPHLYTDFLADLSAPHILLLGF